MSSVLTLADPWGTNRSVEDRLIDAVELYETLARQEVRKYQRKEGYNIPEPARWSWLLTQQRFIPKKFPKLDRNRPTRECVDCGRRTNVITERKSLRCGICRHIWRGHRRERLARQIFSRMIKYCDRNQINCGHFIRAQFEMWTTPTPKPTAYAKPGTPVMPLLHNLITTKARDRYTSWLSLYGPERTKKEKADRGFLQSKRLVNSLLMRNPERYPDIPTLLQDDFVRRQLSPEFVASVSA